MISDPLLNTVKLTGDCQLRVWDNEAVAFHIRSGDTHLLGELATAVLLILKSEGKCHVRDLCSKMLQAWLVEDEVSFHGQIIEVIEDLHSKGLIEAIA